MMDILDYSNILKFKINGSSLAYEGGLFSQDTSMISTGDLHAWYEYLGDTHTMHLCSTLISFIFVVVTHCDAPPPARMKIPI